MPNMKKIGNSCWKNSSKEQSSLLKMRKNS
jgi:hypothetical protein